RSGRCSGRAAPPRMPPATGRRRTRASPPPCSSSCRFGLGEYPFEIFIARRGQKLRGELVGKLADGRGVEQLPQGWRHAEAVVDAREHLDGKQGMAAEVKEVIV